METKIISINETELQVKEYNGQRVVTFADIDRVHERVEGTAKRNFNENKKHLIFNEDYYLVTRKELSTKIVPNNGTLKGNPNIEVVLLTESGYLLLVKSFTDDLAWTVQRQLVNSYFKFQEVISSLQPTNNGLILSEHNFNDALETLTTCAAVFQSMIDYSTINYKQQQEILQLGRNRVNILLGGAHSEEYKEHARVYFKNLWLNFCSHFQCSTYKDLNPLYMDLAREYLSNWGYIE